VTLGFLTTHSPCAIQENTIPISEGGSEKSGCQEFECGGLPVGFSRLEEGGREVRDVHRVRKMLGFEAEAIVLVIDDATGPSIAIKKVTRVKMNARFGRVHLDHPAGVRLAHSGS